LRPVGPTADTKERRRETVFASFDDPSWGQWQAEGEAFRGPSGGTTRSRRKTSISVSSVKSTSTTDLAAKVAGSVDLVFKSDYFKLDNFAQMYGPVTSADRAQVGQGTVPAAAPLPPPGSTAPPTIKV